MSTAMITLDEFKEAMPAHIRKNINPELMADINSAITDPEVLAVFRENVVGLSNVMGEGRFKMDSYLNAVKFVTHKLLGDTHKSAWAKTFRVRYNEAIKRGTSASEIASLASRYASSKLVVLLMGQTMMPTHILNAPLYQRALNVQAELMTNAKSEKVRSDAAANLLMTLKPPEIKKVELDIGLKEDDTIKQLRETTLALARQMRLSIIAGDASAKSIAESKLLGYGSVVDAEIING